MFACVVVVRLRHVCQHDGPVEVLQLPGRQVQHQIRHERRLELHGLRSWFLHRHSRTSELQALVRRSSNAIMTFFAFAALPVRISRTRRCLLARRATTAPARLSRARRTACRVVRVSFFCLCDDSNCRYAGVGKYSGTKGAVQCLDCALLIELAFVISLPCATGPSGSATNANNTRTCALCNTGSYQPSTGQTSCLPCPVGMAINVQGQQRCSACGTLCRVHCADLHVRSRCRHVRECHGTCNVLCVPERQILGDLIASTLHLKRTLAGQNQRQLGRVELLGVSCWHGE